MKYIAAQEEVVLSQRIEKILDKDGKTMLTFDVMGVTRVENGKITWNRDYFYKLPTAEWGGDAHS